MRPVEEKMFCAAPWIHFFVQQDGDVRACCMVPDKATKLGNINEQSWIEIWEGEKFQELRRKFLEKDPETLKYCHHCVQYDKFGKGSCRKTFNDLVGDSKNKIELYLKHPTVRSLDLRTSKTCGLSCIICGPWNSSRWCMELNQPTSNITKKGQENIDQAVDDLKGSIQHLNIVGGEPFMMDEAIDLLKKLQPRKKHIKFIINTNCQTLKYKGQDVLPLLEGFDFVDVAVSLDAVGKAAEYQRYGCRWSTIQSNFEKLVLLAKPNFRISVHPTISILSILHLPDLLSYLEQFEKVEVWGGNMLYDPEEYDIRNLPIEAKKLVEEIILKKAEKLKPENQKLVRGWVEYMNSRDPWIPFSKTVQKITEIDKRRYNNFLDINPELEPWWKLD